MNDPISEMNLFIDPAKRRRALDARGYYPSLQDKIENSSFLITGGLGFIGWHIVRRLTQLKAGKITVIDDGSNPYNTNVEESMVKVINKKVQDIFEPGLFAINDTTGFDYVIHQASTPSVPLSIEDPYGPVKNNIESLHSILCQIFSVSKSTLNKKVKRLVYASSSSVYGDHPNALRTEGTEGRPTSPYAMSKKINEEMAQTFSEIYGIESIGLRYFNVYNLEERNSPAIIPHLLKARREGKKPLIYGDGNQVRDFTHVEDVADANIHACFLKVPNKHEVFNVGNQRGTSINELCELLGLTPEYTTARPGDVTRSIANLQKSLAYGFCCGGMDLETEIEKYLNESK